MHKCLSEIAPSGGLRTLQDRLLNSTKWLVPLVPFAIPAVGYKEFGGGFVSRVWSKGQGTAVDILVHGAKRGSVEADGAIERRAGEELLRERKAGLAVLIMKRPDIPRSKFGF